MTDKTATLEYVAATRRAVLTFPNGRALAIKDVSEDQAREFLEKHSLEFQRRDCCLTSVDGTFSRGESHVE